MSTPRRSSPYRWLILFLGVLIVAVWVYRISTGPKPADQADSSQADSSQAAPSPELRRMRIVPPFALTERSGKTIANHDLAGKIWVADFIYTTCPGPCPLVTANMARLQNAVARDPQVQLVTFTVDPQNDTPAVLAKYADQFKADPNRWWFLTGPEKQIDDLIENGFLQVIQDNRGQPGPFTVTHSTELVLVDAEGVVRGSYDGVGSDGQAGLLKGIKSLEKEENR